MLLINSALFRMLFSSLSARNCVVLQQVLICMSKSVELIVLNVFRSAENEDLFVITQNCAVSIPCLVFCRSLQLILVQLLLLEL